MLNGNEDYLFHQPLIGHFPLYMALAVAVKQLMPHTIISNYSFIRITNKDIPFLLLIVSTTLSILHILDLSVTLRLYSSLIISWIYLRYFHYSSSSSSSSSSLSSSSSNQNRETDFTFHSFFPASIQPYVILLFQIISFGRCGTKKKSSAHTLPMTNDTVIQLDQLNSPIFDLYNLKPKSFVPTKSAIATAKRQQKALDLLNERVQKQAQLSKLSKFDDVTPIVIPGNIEQVSAVTEKSNLNTISEIPQMSTQNKKIVSTTQQQLTDCDDVE
ncbi:hypothetical protein SNEBB_008707 [Seison nebaliae]|nr:hypothetical protein SNEBB_008707 [Seison nebaliae]